MPTILSAAYAVCDATSVNRSYTRTATAALMTAMTARLVGIVSSFSNQCLPNDASQSAPYRAKMCRENNRDSTVMFLSSHAWSNCESLIRGVRLPDRRLCCQKRSNRSIRRRRKLKKLHPKQRSVATFVANPQQHRRKSAGMALQPYAAAIASLMVARGLGQMDWDFQ
jgi:hypothetical protein